MSTKDDFFASLMAPTENRKINLIEEVHSSKILDAESNIENNMPSLLEQMMSAQCQAKQEKEKLKEIDSKKSVKSFGFGFKKGFLGEDKNQLKNSKSKTDEEAWGKANNLVKIKTQKSIDQNNSTNIATIKPSKSSSLVLQEVQTAMKEEESPMLNKVKQGDWLTPELTKTFQSNSILSSGFNNPKCVAALQLMQSNPKDAQKKFQDDIEVNNFLREFGRVMSVHFDSLGQTQGVGQNQSSVVEPTTLPKVLEIGPLHEKALKSQKDVGRVPKNDATRSSDESEAAKVDKIINNPEVAKLLMDVNFQKVLQECGDPAAFRRHLSDPVTAANIRTLQALGLVATER